jgi:hypothetical protein
MTKETYDFCVIITTYNRSDMLKKLLTQIDHEKKNHRIFVAIFDDAGNQNIDINKSYHKKILLYPNNGKRKYYNIINSTLSFLKNISSEYFIYLPDDVSLVENFFDETKRIYESINFSDKICLSILTDGRVNRTNWTDFKTIDYGEYYKTQWNDLCFIAKRNFFERLEFKITPINQNRWKGNPNLSSGVGQQISTRLNNLGLGMYHTKKSLVIHGDHESKMNYHERKVTSLKTNG